jgi:hypothetical protein
MNRIPRARHTTPIRCQRMHGAIVLRSLCNLLLDARFAPKTHPVHGRTGRVAGQEVRRSSPMRPASPPG